MTVSVGNSTLKKYKLIETGMDTGIFVGEITLEEFQSQNVTNNMMTFNVPTGRGPFDGFLPFDNGDDEIVVSFQYSQDEIAYGSAFVKSDEQRATKNLSPLKQFKSGTPFSEIKCNVSLQLTQRHDGTPACVKDGTVFELIKRGWTSDIIRLVQSRDIFLDPIDATSSHMDKITPTIDDFKNVLSEPYDIDVLFSKFGKPHDDVGSGIHIYVYELNDFTEIWFGYVDDILYVKHVDANGNVLEDLFVKNED